MLLASACVAAMPSTRILSTVTSTVAAQRHTNLISSSERLAASGAGTAGGAVSIVSAGFIGSGTAWDEEVGRPTSWQVRMSGDNSDAWGKARQTRVNVGNTAAPARECSAMYEDKPTRGSRDGQNQGRAVTTSVAGGSVSSVRRVAARRIGEPALGVMGGLLQPVSSPAEPPVSSLSGSSSDLTTTAPAPNGDLETREVSPASTRDLPAAA
jgi:hypothetical protein